MVFYIIKMTISAIAFLLFVFISSFVLLYGKRGSGIKMDYAFTALMLIVTMMVLK